ncbi:bestrophin-4 [Drosophila tropicalis]|uniref:bestrophin-4 n=1 Tax=Drosophila tropicalis TaxID=46794 RepID=UPI0035AC20EE
MTVTYTAQVNTSRRISNFLRLLFRWRGSIYKLVWVDLIVYLILYVLLALIYRLLMNENLKRIFELIVYYCCKHVSLIPLAFVLGFYVTIVMDRWWEQYCCIPWPDSIAILISSYIIGFDDRARAMRRTVMRYVCLCQVIVFTMISPQVKKRFPTYTQIIEAGLLLENEKAIIEGLDTSFPHYPKHWMPIVWAASIVIRARRESKIRDDFAVKSIIDELNKFRGYCGFLLYYDWVSVPLVYTQVVTLAVYTFFVFSLIGQQWTLNNECQVPNQVNQYFPFLTILQFFFFMGWLKVAESLINPFGEDDDDFELNWIIDRNLTTSYLIVDEMHQEHPELLKDQYWDDVSPNELPYADESQRQAPPEASTAKLDLHKPTSSSALVDKDSKKPHGRPSIASNISSDNFLHHVLTKQNSLSSSFDLSSLQISSSDQKFYRHRKLGAENSHASLVREQHAEQLDSGDRFKLREPGENSNSDVRPKPSNMNFDELIEQRHRERRARMRSRFLNMRSTHTRTSPSGGYTVTILRPPSLLSTHDEQDELDEMVEENSEDSHI